MRTKEKRQHKGDIKNLQNKLITILTDLKVTDRDEDKEVSKANIAAARVDLNEAKDRLKMFMMNKTGSSAFEWHPHIGPNRRTRKQFKKMLNKR